MRCVGQPNKFGSLRGNHEKSLKLLRDVSDLETCMSILHFQEEILKF